MPEKCNNFIESRVVSMPIVAKCSPSTVNGEVITSQVESTSIRQFVFNKPLEL